MKISITVGIFLLWYIFIWRVAQHSKFKFFFVYLLLFSFPDELKLIKFFFNGYANTPSNKSYKQIPLSLKIALLPKNKKYGLTTIKNSTLTNAFWHLLTGPF